MGNPPKKLVITENKVAKNDSIHNFWFNRGKRFCFIFFILPLIFDLEANVELK